MSQKLFLIDGTAMAYRSYFAMMKAGLRNAEGLPTGALLGYTNIFLKLIEKEKPDYLGVIWDTHAPTFRHEMDENYKANRPPQPEELSVSIPMIKDLISFFGYKNLEKEGYEADDIIGTLASQAIEQNVTVYMVTPDKDFMQLVSENVLMYKPLPRGDGFDLIDINGVKTYFGVHPEKVIDVLALTGDTSDNIPGVPGIGKKGAAILINEYGSIEKAIEKAENIKNKRSREGLMNNKEQALKSRDLVTIDTHVPETINWKSLKRGSIAYDKLYTLFKRMEFTALLKKYANSFKEFRTKSPDNNQQGLLFEEETKDIDLTSDLKTFDSEKTQYRLCSSPIEVEMLKESLEKSKKWSFDTETTSTNSLNADLLGISFSSKQGEGWYVDVLSLDKTWLLDFLQPLFASPDHLKIAHHLKYDYQILHQYGFSIEPPFFDTMLAAHLVKYDQKLDMDSLSKSYLGYEPISITSLIGEKGKSQKNMKEVPVEKVAVYACEDADITFQLYDVLEKELSEIKVSELANSLEFPLAVVLGRMELNGVKINLDLLASFSEELKRDMATLQEQIYALAGREFNINSTQQLGSILFEELGIPSTKKTATGKYATSEAVLMELASEHDIVKSILDFRKLTKLKSTYVDALPKLVNKKTRRIHTTYNQHITATGRLSSTNPNLQNIPVRTERGRGIRKAFVASKETKLLAADYSQIELRIIASISSDKAMIQAFRDDEDIHSRTAMEIFGLSSLDEVTRDQRSKAKEVNFGIPYGISAFGLASRLGISNKAGKEMIDAYFEKFPAIKTYIKETIKTARDKGYVETLSGRRRYITDIHSSNWNVRSFAERTAVNMPIQGTAADLIKKAMIEIDKELANHSLKSKMILQVHDELVLEVPGEEQELVSKLVKNIMENSMKLDVPLTVELAYSDNWLDAH